MTAAAGRQLIAAQLLDRLALEFEGIDAADCIITIVNRVQARQKGRTIGIQEARHLMAACYLLGQAKAVDNDFKRSSTL